VDRESDSVRSFPHGDVDADQFAVDVEQRPAGVSGVDVRVGLDQIRELDAAQYDEDLH
jgi:hypothetical protein